MHADSKKRKFTKENNQKTNKIKHSAIADQGFFTRLIWQINIALFLFEI